MTFTLTNEQEMLRDSAERFVREHYDFDTWRKRAAAGQVFCKDRWQAMAALGWMMMGVPETHGGMGGGIKDVMVLMEALGTGLVLEPYISTCVLGERLLRHGRPGLVEGCLPALMQGGLLTAVATYEARGRFDFGFVETTATREGDAYVITGEKAHVPDARMADYLIIPARTEGAADDRQGISLFLVPSDAAGLTREDFRSPDYSQISRVTLKGVRVGIDRMLGMPGGGFDLLEEAIDFATVARMAEALGVMDSATRITLEYLKTREQFGRKIGQFQALQHRIVDMTVACEEARAITYAAGAALADTPAERRRAVSAAKVRVGQTGMYVGHEAVQLHGGVGTTDELIISHYLKRLAMLDIAFGNPVFHLERFSQASWA